MDFTLFDSWTKVAALLIFLAVPAFFTWLTQRTVKQVKQTSESAAETMRAVESTLTTTNGGSHVKDQLNRIETAQREHLAWSEGWVREADARMTALEKRRRLFR